MEKFNALKYYARKQLDNWASEYGYDFVIEGLKELIADYEEARKTVHF